MIFKVTFCFSFLPLLNCPILDPIPVVPQINVHLPSSLPAPRPVPPTPVPVPSTWPLLDLAVPGSSRDTWPPVQAVYNPHFDPLPDATGNRVTNPTATSVMPQVISEVKAYCL